MFTNKASCLLITATQRFYSLRGLASNVTAIFLDEFLFMNPSAFPAIFPSTATGAMLVMISSMSGDSNSPAMKIINAKYDDGTDVVKKFNWVQSCVACKRKGVPEKCSHIRREPQHFQDLASQARLSKLMDPRAYAIEVLYVLSCLFLVIYVNRVF